MRRREFLTALAGMAGALRMVAPAGASLPEAQVMTTVGRIERDRLGPMLPHEHLLVDFVGADKVNRNRYDPAAVVEVVLPRLRRAAELGLRTLAECTPAYLGRDAALMKRFSEASGLNIITNTGYYGAASGKFLPAHAFSETADQLASRWTREWEDGIEDTGLRPGFVKTGVDGAPLSEMSRKLVIAAARTHLATGLTIASHTGKGIAATEQLETIAREGVDASAFIWVHAQAEEDPNLHARAAEMGAWVEFDGLGQHSVPRHVELVRAMRERGLLHRTLVSHDAGWYEVGKPGGGNFRPFDTLFTTFIPALREAGLSHEDISRLTAGNPQEAFSIRVRRRS